MAMDWDAFFTLHSDLPREGPGDAADVLWALDLAGVPAEARILDAGCGPGADTAVLAQARPEAWIDAIDRQAGLVAEAAARLARFGPRVKVWQGDMGAIAGPYDLIWSAGAVYFLGVTEALRAWRPALTRAGRIAFSEPVLLGGPEPKPAAVARFWADYPRITDAGGIAARIAAAGFAILGTRLIVGAPWAAYYEPLARRIADLRAGQVMPALAAVLDAAEVEIAAWRAAPERIAYQLAVVAPA